MLDTLLERSEDSRGEFIRDCGSLVTAGLHERGSSAGRRALGGVAALACASGLAVALTTGGSSPGPARNVGVVPMAWELANMRVVETLGRQDARCQIRAPRADAIRLLDGAPSTDVTSLFAVLRRPSPLPTRVSAAQLRALQLDAQGFYVRYSREGVTDGITYYLIPAANVGGLPLPGSCSAKQLAAFERRIAELSPQARARAISWERQVIKEREGPRPGIVLVTAGAGGRGASYLTVDRLRHPFHDEGGDGSNSITKTALLVPDSVASVTARYAAQTYPGRVVHPVEVTRRVTDNLAIFVFRGAWDPPSLTYRSATGAVLSSTLRG
jgi:hypothetical protein